MPLIQDVATQPRAAVPDADTPDEAHPGVVRAGLAFTYLGAATVPWTGIELGPPSLGEIFLILAAITLVMADLRRPLPQFPPWVKTLVFAVLLTGIINQFFPPALSYMAQRNQSVGTFVVHGGPQLATNLTVLIPLLVRTTLLPFVFIFAYSYDKRALFRSAMGFVAGVVISSLIAFTDSRGLTAIGPRLTGVPVALGRASGLTKQANVVAMGCVIALPFAVWQALAAKGRNRLLAVLAFFGILLGLYASRSRSGAGTAAVAGVAALAWLPQYRRHLPTVAFVLASLTAVLFAAEPKLGTHLLTALRITGTDTTGSDRARDLVNEQAMHDFLHSPIHGIGYEVADVSHTLYLQTLAVGGLILLGGFLVYVAGGLARSARLARVEPMAIPLFVAALGQAVFCYFQNALTPSLTYLAGGLIAALPLTRDAAESGDPPAAAERPVPAAGQLV